MKVAKYNACGNPLASVDFPVCSSDSRVLTTYGVPVDSVDQIVRLLSRAMMEGRDGTSVHRNLSEAGHDIERSFEYMTNVSPDNVNWAQFWRTLDLDRSVRHTGCRATDSGEKYVEAALMLLVELFLKDKIQTSRDGRSQWKASKKRAKRKIFRVSRGSPQTSLLREHRISKMCRSSETQQAIFNNISMIITLLHREKEFCIAKSGAYGWVPYVARDVVAVLQGYEVPIVLRSVGNGTYRVVGDCYLDGIMDGEALKKVKEGDLVRIQLA